MSLMHRTGRMRSFRKFCKIKLSEHVRESKIPKASATRRAKMAKRGQECTSLNGLYNANGTRFNLLCDTSWQCYDALYISFTLDFPTCIDGCGMWNINRNQNECVGAQWTNDIYGPTYGNRCTYLWTMPNTDKTPLNTTDTAQLQTSPLFTATVQFFKSQSDIGNNSSPSHGTLAMFGEFSDWILPGAWWWTCL